MHKKIVYFMSYEKLFYLSAYVGYQQKTPLA